MEKSLINLEIREHEIEGYERVVEFIEREAELHAIIVLHDTRLGPAIGGTRLYPYASFEHAMNDALRLAKGMTYKSGIAQTGTSGGKSVIIADYRKPKPRELLLAFAEAVNYFEGQYICAEDVGVTVDDLGVISEGTIYAVGLPHPQSSGDPAPYTTYGGYRGIQAACQAVWTTDSVSGKVFAVQGLGAVGMRLAEKIFWGGGELIVTDIDETRIEKAVKLFGARAVAPEAIYDVKCDVFVPCAMGAVINHETIQRLKCKAVAGLANNQLLTREDGQALFDRGILYAPDYVINGGGLHNVCTEVRPEGYDPVVARAHVDRIYSVLLEIFKRAEKKGVSTHQIADEMVHHNLEHGIGRRTEPITFHHQKAKKI